MSACVTAVANSAVRSGFMASVLVRIGAKIDSIVFVVRMCSHVSCGNR